MEFPRIDELDYFTNRRLESKDGTRKGKIIIYRKKGEKPYHTILDCPECGHHQEKDIEIKRRPFRIQCEKCGNKIVVTSLKKEIKK